MTSEHEDSQELDSVIHDVPDDHPARQFRLGKFLGRGGFAKCYEMTYLGRHFAGKIIPKASL